MNETPMATTGRDLRMTLDIRATASGDQVLSSLIEEAVRQNSEGKMYAGKTTTVTRGNACVTLVMSGYAQTWDGEGEEEAPPSPPIERILELAANPDSERATFDLVPQL